MVKKLLKYNIFLFFVLFITYIPVHSTASAETIIQDDAGILSPNKEPEIQSLCDKIYKEYNTSVYIAIRRATVRSPIPSGYLLQ